MLGIKEKAILLKNAIKRTGKIEAQTQNNETIMHIGDIGPLIGAKELVIEISKARPDLNEENTITIRRDIANDMAL